MWWEIGRELSEDKAWDLTDIGDMTIAQLTAPRYGLDSSGRIKVEKKDETKKRIGRSPDDADALLLAFYSGHQPELLFDESASGLALDGVPLMVPFAGTYAMKPSDDNPYI